jgi:putative transposase
VFYTDHGSDFTSQHMEQVAADLKMRLIFSKQGEPRGRGKIERFFETVNQLFLSKQPGYAPPGSPKPPPLLTLAQLEERLHTFLLATYLLRTHGETDMPPQARWEAGGFLPQLPESLEQLDLLLLTVAKARKVQQDGIYFRGLRYIDLTLAAYVGEPVIIRYDPRDMAEIRVFYRATFLCRAICQELAGETISLKEVVQARKARLGHLRAGLSAREAVVEAFLAVHQVEAPPVEQPPPPEPAPPRLKRYFNE